MSLSRMRVRGTRVGVCSCRSSSIWSVKSTSARRSTKIRRTRIRIPIRAAIPTRPFPAASLASMVYMPIRPILSPMEINKVAVHFYEISNTSRSAAVFLSLSLSSGNRIRQSLVVLFLSLSRIYSVRRLRVNSLFLAV